MSVSSVKKAQEVAAGTPVGVAWFSAAPERLTNFYGGVFGFEFEERKHPDGSHHWVCQDQDGLHIEIKSISRHDDPIVASPDALASPTDTVTGVSRIEISFVVNDIERSVNKAISEGGAVALLPVDHGWGPFATVTDPDGNRIGLWQSPAETDSASSNDPMRGSI